MNSPTGYYANFTVRIWKNGRVDSVLQHESRPILFWSEANPAYGQHRNPIIADEEGRLMTPEEYLRDNSQPDPDGEPGEQIKGSFEVQPWYIEDAT
jgi:hypothetical protein